MTKDIAFKQIYSVLKNQFKSIDMRGIFAYSHDEDLWKCAFLKLYFSKLETSKLKEFNNKIGKKYKKIDKIDFKVILEEREIEEVDLILKNIQNLHVQMSDLDARPMGTNYQNIFLNNTCVRNYSFDSNIDAIESYPMKALVSVGDYRPFDVINRCKVDLNKYRINFSDLIYHLGVNDLNIYSDLLIILPIYCKQLENDSQKYIAKFEINDKLASNTEATLTLKNENGKLLENSDNIDIETIAESSDQPDMKIFYLPKFKQPIKDQD